MFEVAVERGFLTPEQGAEADRLTRVWLDGLITDAEFDAEMVKIGVAEAVEKATENDI